jgi:hypothetical protein
MIDFVVVWRLGGGHNTLGLFIPLTVPNRRAHETSARPNVILPSLNSAHRSDCSQQWNVQTFKDCHKIFTYLLTPWSRVLLQKLTGFAASQEIPRIYGTPKFITLLTSARHLSLSLARSIQSPQPHPTSWRSILILPSHLRLGLPNGLVPSGFPTRHKTFTSNNRQETQRQYTLKKHGKI